MKINFSVGTNKNRDGTHTAFEIVSHTKPSNCEHNINILYRKLD